MIDILILEDSAGKLARVSEVLLSAGATSSRITVAPDAATARRLLRGHRYELFVIDLAVPEILGGQVDRGAGRKVLEDIFESDAYLLPIQVVGLTAYSDLAELQGSAFQALGVVLVQYEDGHAGWEDTLRMCFRRAVTNVQAEAISDEGYDCLLGVICALEIELAAVERLDWNWTELQKPGDPTFYMAGFFEANGERHDVVAALCPRMGTSAAAITATRLITTFKPRFVAMAGITAGLKSQARIGDVLVADQCWDWEAGKWVTVEGEPRFVPGPHHIALDASIRTEAFRLSRDREMLDSVKNSWGDAPSPAGEMRVLIAPMASGNAVIAAQEMSEQIAAHHRKLAGIDMESYAVYAAAAEASHPRPTAIAIKAISDLADEEKSDQWRFYAAFASAQILARLAEKFLCRKNRS